MKNKKGGMNKTLWMVLTVICMDIIIIISLNTVYVLVGNISNIICLSATLIISMYINTIYIINKLEGKNERIIIKNYGEKNERINR
jgi:hypothetical protein